jgi:gliding motility-associated-like protein
MTAIYEIEDENNFSNRTFDHVDVNFVVSALTFAVDFPEFTIIPRFCIPLGFTDICFELVIPGFSFGFGPLIGPYTMNIAGFDFPPYFNNEWSLGGLNKVDTISPFRLTPRKFKLDLNSTPTLCNGDNTGTTTLAVSGATTPYLYEWSNGASTQNLLTAKAGRHYITVTDANGCRAYNSVVIGEPTAIQSSTTGTNILCNGAITGDAVVAASGGTGPYTYSWTPSGAASASASALAAGLHRVVITDNNGCPKADSILLTEPPAIRSVIANATEPTCNGFSDGTIQLEVSGGVEPYDYNWSNGASTKNLLNLPAGNYSVLITDGNGCSRNSTVALNEPTLLEVTLSVVNNVSCNSGSNGELLATPSGGTLPYSYKWLNNAATLSERTASLKNLKASAYSIEVRDKNNCLATDNISVSEPAQRLSVALTSTNVICYGNSDGTVNTTIAGGTSPYSLLWSNGTTGTSLNTIPAGKYSVVVADANGCQANSQTLITQPAKMAVFLKTTDVTCSDQQDGTVSVENVVGGTPPYNYSWTNGNTTDGMTELAAGTYEVIITDQKGCTGIAATILNKKEGKCLFIPNAFSPNGDGTNDTWVIRNIHLYPNSKLTIVNKWGETIYTAQPYSDPWDGKRNGVLMPLATYFYVLDLGNGEAEYTGALTILK